MCTSAATNTTGPPLRQIKIPWQWVSCAEQRWWTFIYMVALKKMVWAGLGSTVKNSGPARLGPGDLGDKQGGLSTGLARLGLAWLGLVSGGKAGVGGWGGGGGLPPPPPSTHLIK